MSKAQASVAQGFIGLGVMGEPICRHLVTKTRLLDASASMIAYDINHAVLDQLSVLGVTAAQNAAMLAAQADTIFLSLPSGEVVEQVILEQLWPHLRDGQAIIDLSTSAVDTTRALALRLAQRGVVLIDAPVARTRAAAEQGSLSVMVGATREQFDRIEPLLRFFATDITHCGPVGCGQVAKILNNMVLFETVAALSEALAIGQAAGIDKAVLFDTLSKGSADSFALRNHGIKAMLPQAFPARAFSVRYAQKDLGYALRLARQAGIAAAGADNVNGLFERAIHAGLGDLYHPVISELFKPAI
jgi:3-hydroxyisobutyrate dehydrogenase-like beta-hydroxyacid dehydrogenase